MFKFLKGKWNLKKNCVLLLMFYKISKIQILISVSIKSGIRIRIKSFWIRHSIMNLHHFESFPINTVSFTVY